MKKINFVVLMSVAMLGSGCASIVSGTNQNLTVETRSKEGQPVISANCKLSNNKGTWYVTSPGSVVVSRSYENLLVNCEKADQAPGLASIKSSTKGMAFGNILFGGVIGAGVDIASGAAYDYPTMITVLMGGNVTVDAPSPDTPVQTQPQAAAATVSTAAIDPAAAEVKH